MGKTVVRIGQRYGKLVTNGIIGKDTHDGGRLWACQCDCGKTVVAKATHLSGGKKKSCGCLRTNFINSHPGARQKSIETKRLQKAQRIYKIWTAAHLAQRCGVEPWDQLTELDKRVWLFMAERLHVKEKADERVEEGAHRGRAKRDARNRGPDPHHDGHP